MQIVSFDFGTKKIGIAVGQTITKSSSPLTVLFNKDNKVNWEEVSHIVREWKPDLLLIGKPLNMDGTDSDIMKLVEKFSKKLAKLTDIKCEYVDERLTSFEARQNFKELMIENNKSIKKEIIDANAAKILIDNWFNQNVDSF